eukprot:TRINITY_DN2364_c0_g1::TRINITY_DN2364_c0_g1_i1::g.20815::m.20815 TRINITY_DN2364_c0_g1::TRINITY_DN2364_c0_g1_i1::g.20815  ORF type:complete len:163 (+),score=18.23 TRINITY_DN2364_c0_g1_i1:113-601(+)
MTDGDWILLKSPSCDSEEWDILSPASDIASPILDDIDSPMQPVTPNFSLDCAEVIQCEDEHHTAAEMMMTFQPIVLSNVDSFQDSPSSTAAFAPKYNPLPDLSSLTMVQKIEYPPAPASRSNQYRQATKGKVSQRRAPSHHYAKDLSRRMNHRSAYHSARHI